MSFSINRLTTTEECDNMLALVQKERSDVDYRKQTQERRRDSYSERSSQVSADLQAVITEIASLTTVIASLADGDVKDELEGRKTRLEYRKFLLEERSENYGNIALIDQELAVALSELILTEIDAFIAQVEAHKATL